MNKVYVVLYNGRVSSEGYSTVEKAIEFIKSRLTPVTLVMRYSRRE